MIDNIVSNYETSKKVAKTIFEELNMESCGIELEFGDHSPSIKDIGFCEIYNHHLKNLESYNKQPCLAFQDTNRYDSFIISHIDTDTIFGIGWLAGWFDPTNKLLIELSKIISVMDNFGSHSLSDSNLKKYYKELEVISSCVNEAKTKLNKIKPNGFYNCTPIIKKTILKILDHLMNENLLNKKYNFIHDAKSKFLKIKPIEETETYRLYDKKINDFKTGNHKFIIIYKLGISIYSRDVHSTNLFFPEGIITFMNKYFPGSGGHFNACGSPRMKKIPRKEFERFYKDFKNRINDVLKKGVVCQSL